jgi:hypothetical protein
MNATPPENTEPTEVRITDSGALIATLPYLLGFRPADSIVVVGLSSGERAVVTGVLRADLPDPAVAKLAAAALVLPLLDRSPGSVILVIIGGSDGQDLPARAFIESCAAALQAAEITVDHSLWAATTMAGARWGCYDDPDCGGIVPDMGTSALAAASVLAGQVTHASREELLAELEPDQPDVLARHAALLDSLAAQHRPHRSDPYRRLHQLDAAIRRAQDGVLPGAEESMRLVLALRDHSVRDACLIHAVGSWSEGAERLWRHLVRVTPGPDRAEPALLLGVIQYLRHDGIPAGMSLDLALAANPRHRMASLMREALSSAMPPEELQSAINRAAVEAHDLVMASSPDSSS